MVENIAKLIALHCLCLSSKLVFCINFLHLKSTQLQKYVLNFKFCFAQHCFKSQLSLLGLFLLLFGQKPAFSSENKPCTFFCVKSIYSRGSKEEDREPPIYAGIIKPNRTLKNFSGEQLIQFIHKPLNRGTNIDGSKLSFSFVFVDSLSRTGAYQ